MSRFISLCSKTRESIDRPIRFLDRLFAHSMLITLLAILPCRAAETTVFPGADWAEATPESQSVNSAKLKLDGKAKDDVWNGFLAEVGESLE